MTLKPGQKTTVSWKLDAPRTSASTTTRASFRVETGTIEVYAGDHSSASDQMKTFTVR